jgi:HK97 family phage portal protein
MNLVASLLGGRIEKKVADASSLTWSALGVIPSKSGVTVSVDKALRVATALACLRVLGEGVAQLPLKLLQEQASGAKLPAKKHPLYRILWRRPNSWMTSFELRETLTYHAALAKGGFAYISRVGDQVDELIPLVPGNVTIRYPTQMAGAVEYDVTLLGGRVLRLRRDEVLHVRGPSWDGYVGMEVVSLAREALGLAIATEESQGTLHANSARPAGILTTDSVLKKPAKEELRAEWKQTFGGANQGGTAVLDAGFKFQQLAMTGVDAQHLETRRHQVEEICRMFRVFPQMIGYTDKTATFASAEAFFSAHVVHSLGPWLERWEQAMCRDLLTEADLEAGYFPKFIVNGLLRGDAKSRAEYFKAALGTASSPGWMSPNDVRRAEDLDPDPDPDADQIVTADDMAGAGDPPADPAAADAQQKAQRAHELELARIRGLAAEDLVSALAPRPPPQLHVKRDAAGRVVGLFPRE